MFLQIKKIPELSWSSKSPRNLRPSLKTLFLLCFGLILFGLGEGLLIISTIGASPWNVFHQGLFLNLGLSIGTWAFLVSLIILLLWIFLDEKMGIGTILNFVIIAIMIDISIYFFEAPQLWINQFLLSIISILMVGLGSGIYLIARLGPGPRDGLMTGLQKKTNFSIAPIRGAIEVIVVLCGWILGGTVGLGTLLYALGVGPSVALGLNIVKKISK
ncbi:YitT family protein [Pelagibacteraceae bacterium]|nr:YitT family protein [Pelagibacteraceae bacterium]